MAKYISGRQKNLKVGISSYSENLTSLEVIGNVGIATTNATSKLYVVGDGYFTGVVTASNINVSGASSFSQLYVSGVSTLGVTSATNLTAQQLNVSGVSTLPTLLGTTISYSTGNFTNGYIVTGVVTTLTSTNATLTNINSSGISTLGVTTVTRLTAQSINSSGIVTGSSFRPSTGYYQSANGTNSFYVYDGTGNVAFQGTIGASQINNASGFKALDFTTTSTPFVNITNGLNVGTGATILTTTSSGNIGIGSTIPTSKLDIIGDVKLTGVITATTFSGQINAGVATITTLSGTTATYGTGNFTTGNIVTGVVTTLTSTNATLTNINSSGISTLGITSATNLTAQQLNVSGVSTFTGSITGTISTAVKLQNPRTFEITGDIVASPISFDGTGNVSLAATIQPNSVGLGTDTTGDYVQTISGTANQITVTGGTGESSTPTLSIPTQFTIPQDATVTRDLQVNRNLNVTGNITIGGTTAFVNVQELRVTDPDLVLGFRTDINGNDASNDTTANHGGIAVASTEGNPLVSLYNPGIGESTLPTYKKIMWFKSGAFSGLGTDAWLINYAVGIGSTQFPTGTRLAAGNVQFTQNDLAVVRNINASGVVTTSQINVTGVSTLGVTSTTNLTTQQLNVSGVSTHTGISTFQSSLFGTQASFTGVVTATTFNGQVNAGVGTITTLTGTTATYGTGNFTTGNIVTGVVTTLTSTNATLTNINSSGISGKNKRA